MNNRLTELLGIEMPILLGGMGNISSPVLAAAVSNAGGLGTIGAGTRRAEEVRPLVTELKNSTERPFALNIALSVNDDTERLLGMAVELEVPVISLSAGNPAPYVAKLQQHGIKVLAVCGTVRHAMKAEQAGVDVIVAEGVEAAGITAPHEITSMALIPQVAKAVSIPIVAAGGIADGKGMLAAMALGADGVQMGTRLVAVKESPVSEVYKRRLIEAKDTDTVLVGRPFGTARRVLKGSYTQTLLQLESRGYTQQQYNEATSELIHWRGAMEGDEAAGFMNGGQIAGLISDIPSVSELFSEMASECKSRLETISRML